MSPVPATEIAFNLAYAAAFVRAFADKLGLERVSLIGNSMGGGIALKFAIDYPERTAGLVLANAVGLGKKIGRTIRLLSSPGSARLALRLVTRQTVRQVWESMLIDPTLATEERVEHTWQWLQRPETREYLVSIYRNGVTIRGQKDILVQDLVRIKAPTCIVWGAQDQVLPAAHARRAQQLIPDSVLLALPKCGHIPQLENAGEFNRFTHEFLL